MPTMHCVRGRRRSTAPVSTWAALTAWVVFVACATHGRPTDANNHNAEAVHAAGQRGEGVTIAFFTEGHDADMNGLGRPHRAYYDDGDLGAFSRLIAVPVGVVAPESLPGAQYGLAIAAIAAGGAWGTAPGAYAGHAPRAGIRSYVCQSTSVLNALMLAKAQHDATPKLFQVASVEATSDAGVTSLFARALDELALADVLVTVKAGLQKQPHPTATNALAVGMVHLDDKQLDPSSASGLASDAQRIYPDLVAAGWMITTPKADDETNPWQGGGTSLSHPNVAGAAALYRAQKPSASALETKAAILATVERLPGQNATAAMQNGYGVGYLRTDWLHRVALGADTTFVANDTVTVSESKSFTIAVVPGERYAAAIAWFRQKPSQPTWSNLALHVKGAASGIAGSDSPRNLYERIEFKAALPAVSVTVSAASLENGQSAQAFALVFYGPLP